MKHSIKTKTFQNLYLCLLFSGIAFPSYSQTTLKDDNLSGNVTSVTETTYTTKIEKGIPVKDEFVEMFVYSYDDEGRMIQITKFNKYKKQSELKKYQYDNQGRLSVKIEYESKELKYTTKYNYPVNDKLSEEKSYIGPLEEYYGNKSYIYDSIGNLVEVTDNTNAFSRTVKIYNKKNLVIEEKIYNAKTEKLVYLNSYAYDQLGRKINVTLKNVQSDFTINKEFVYNEMGGFSLKINTTGQDKYSKSDYKYDRNKNIVAYNDRKDSYTCDYTFDASNNWVKCLTKTIVNGSIGYEIKERKIKYVKNKK